MFSFELDNDLRPHIDAAALLSLFNSRAGRIEGKTEVRPSLISWQDLNNVLASHRLNEPRLRVAGVPDGDPIVRVQHGRRDVKIPRLSLDSIISALSGGGTLVLDAIDETHPKLRALTRAFARTFGSVPQTNLYASFGSSPGFGLHWDDHDVFVFQISGRKHWRIFNPTRTSPSYRDVDSPGPPATDCAPYFDEIIDPGTIIYVPRGHWHDVVGLDEPSLHLTVGITHPTASDLLNWLADEIRAVDELRADIPLFDEAAAQKHENALRNYVEKRFAGNLVGAYLEFRRTQLAYRAEPSLPASVTRRLSPESEVIWIALNPPRRNQSGETLIRADNKSLTLAPETWGLVDSIWCTKRATTSELARGFGTVLTAPQIATVILTLADFGAVAIHD